MDNPKFNEIKAKHPDWSDEQIWTALSLNMEADNVIENAGDDIDPNDPDIIKEIIIGAQNWLREVLPNIFAKVAQFFERMISTIGEWVQKGLSYVVDAIARLLGKN
ncbi:MAG: hypothetical protein K2I69_07495 [Muribaculaceae bacterium]|nr:hypothetical protein [Muribaculaceae bacterium]